MIFTHILDNWGLGGPNKNITIIINDQEPKTKEICKDLEKFLKSKYLTQTFIKTSHTK